MSEFLREYIAADDAECGVFWKDIAGAILTWRAMNFGEDRSVADAAKAFNTSPSVIREAITVHAYWVFISGPDDDYTKQMIELDGE